MGAGREAVDGKLVDVIYSAYLYDPRGPNLKGQIVEERGSFQSGAFPFRIGTRAVIPGFEQGVIGMRVGGSRRLTVPPHLAYGATGNGSQIPGNAWLVFDVQLTNVRD